MSEAKRREDRKALAALLRDLDEVMAALAVANRARVGLERKGKKLVGKGRWTFPYLLARYRRLVRRWRSLHNARVLLAKLQALKYSPDL